MSWSKRWARGRTRYLVDVNDGVEFDASEATVNGLGKPNCLARLNPPVVIAVGIDLHVSM